MGQSGLFCSTVESDIFVSNWSLEKIAWHQVHPSTEHSGNNDLPN